MQPSNREKHEAKIRLFAMVRKRTWTLLARGSFPKSCPRRRAQQSDGRASESRRPALSRSTEDAPPGGTSPSCVPTDAVRQRERFRGPHRGLPDPPAPRESGERTRCRQTRGRRAAQPTGRAAGVLTAFGLYGGWISLRSSFSQSMYRKNACSLTSRSPSGPQPRRLPGCLVISCKRTQRSATWDELREGRTGKDGGFQLAARPRRDLPARPA